MSSSAQPPTGSPPPPPKSPRTASAARLAHAGQAARERGRVRLANLRNLGGRKATRVLGRVTVKLPPTPLGGLCGIADAMPLSAEEMILSYSHCLYPMDYGGRLRWHCPNPRFVLYLDELRISSNMLRDVSKAPYTYSFDRAPREVLEACAARPGNTWLSERLRSLFLELFEMGAVHSVEAWQGDTLVGGSFGLSIGRVFTLESMFHRAPNAGKAQFIHLAKHLTERGYVCVDGQEYAGHFARFGAREIPLTEYRTQMARGLVNPARFGAEG